MIEQTRTIKLFYCYAHEDEAWRDRLERHMAALRHDGLIAEWSDHEIQPGADWDYEVETHLNTADIILLLISPDFIHSNYCYSKEVKRALERQKNKEAYVIPIILRPVDWEETPIGKLQALPKGAKPITLWANPDEAFLDTVKSLRKVISSLLAPIRKTETEDTRTTPRVGTPTHDKDPHALSLPRRRSYPLSYLPIERNHFFQPRPNEFEHLEAIFFDAEIRERPARLGLVGVVGLGGIGKTQLAVEFAHRCQDRGSFPGGVFWTPATGTTFADWQRHLANLALRADYLPIGDDPSRSDNEERRARHMARFLAQQSDAFLILDNVERPDLILRALPNLAGQDIACAILYTSRVTAKPVGIETYVVEQLPEENALRLLLQTTRPHLLTATIVSQSIEFQAAQDICRRVGYLPLALIHLRGLLAKDSTLTLQHLKEGIEARGALELTQIQSYEAASLLATFALSWEGVQDEDARRLFKLASFFPEAVPIPRWLIGLAAGLGEQGEIIEPLGQVLFQLYDWSLLQELSGEQFRLHPLIREFGQRLVRAEQDQGRHLCEEAMRCLQEAGANLSWLEQRALHRGFWECLEQVRAMSEYAAQLEIEQSEALNLLQRMSMWLDRESYLLKGGLWWPNALPGLFFQQLYNRALEEGYVLTSKGVSHRWLRHRYAVGENNQSLLRVLEGHTEGINDIVCTPDGKWIVTGSNDKTARVWDWESGKQVMVLEGHTGWINEVMCTPDSRWILTAGSSDQTASVWNRESGEQVMVLKGHTWWVNNVTCTPDGKWIVTGSWDKTVRVWDRESGKQVQVLEGNTGGVTSIACSPDGHWIVAGSGGPGAKVRIWDWKQGKRAFVLKGHTHGVNSIAFSPDGCWMLTGDRHGTVLIWDWEKKQQAGILVKLTNEVQGLVFSPDGCWVMIAGGDGTQIWDWKKRKQIRVLDGWHKAAAFSPDIRWLLTGGSRENVIRIWRWSGEEGESVLSGGTEYNSEVVQREEKENNKLLVGQQDSTNHKICLPSGLVLTASYDDTKVQIWEGENK